MAAKILLVAVVLTASLLGPVQAGPLVGDLDGNWKVDWVDLQIFADQWLVPSGSADFDGANGVNMADFAILAQNWHKQSGALVISEFMAQNDSNLPDPEDPTKFWDWIEIYNPSDVNINLNDWSLKYQAVGGSVTQWKFPSVELDPGQFLVVFASEKNHRDPTKPLHTNFKLRASGAYLGLLMEDGVTVSHEYAPQYPEQLGDISYGLRQNATTLVATGATVSYLVPTVNDAGKPWTLTSFSDSGWDSGKTPLSFASAPETGQDIGNPAAKGSHTLSNGVYTVKGDGGDIWYAADQFYYVYASLKGDGELTARVVSMDNTNEWAKAGVMIRETLDADSKHAMAVVTPGNGTDFQWRTNTSGTSSNAGPTAHQTPYWVRIKRAGSTFTGYVSPDGNTWTQQGSTTITMADDTYIGLCVTSHVGGTLCTAVFDNVKTGSGITSNLKQKMLGINTSLWTRIKFNLKEGQADLFNRLTLRVRYEDGFVAYLNGQQVARRNAPASPLWNSTADSNRPNDQSLTFESINITAFKSLLQIGTNVLAIQAMNDNKNDEQFLILPQLVASADSSIPEYFATATPGTFNISGAKGIVDDVSFSHERGFYDAQFYLTLCTDEPDAVIRYTLDGSRPTAVHGYIYNPASRPLISKTTCVRALAVKPGYLDSKVGTNTYIFVSDVIRQSPYGEVPGPNWPSGSVNGQVIDYGMDPDIVNSPTYSSSMYNAMLAIPTISLVTDLANLFDPSTGIYVHADQRGRLWERPTSVELINPDGSEGFQIDGGLRMRGGYSRWGDNPKHAFRLFFRDEYGQDKLKFPLFGDEGVDEFDCIDLRTSMNYSWSYDPYDGGPTPSSTNNTFVRDEFSRDLQGAVGAPYTRSRYYHLYINGQYWGLFETQERPEASYAESYFGGNKDDYDVVKVEYGSYVIEATDGTLDAYQRLWEAATAGFATNEAYCRVQGLNTDGTRNPAYEKLVDIDNVIDYMLNTFYVGDCDGPISNFLGNNNPNNLYGIYNRNNPDGFKFFRHDAEHTLGTLDWCYDRTGPYPAGQQFQHFNPQWLHQQLVAHPDYRMRFADRAYKALFNNGPMTPSAAISRIWKWANQIDLAIIGESARWGDAKTHPALNRNDHWLPAVNWIVNNHLPSRASILLGQLKSKGWYPNVEPPTFSSQGGYVPSGFQLSMTAPAGTIYYTLDGNDPRVPAYRSSAGGLVTLVHENDAKQVLVPSVANGGNLLSNTLPQFDVTYYKANITVGDLTTAESVISTPAYQSSVVTAKASVINYFNTGDLGHFGNDSNFPGTVINNDVEDFVILATGTVFIPQTGYWTFGVSSDDGFGLKLTKGATTWLDISYPDPRGPGDSFGQVNITQTGVYNVRLVFFEQGGGSELELFAAKGSFGGFDPSFRLVGDVAGGGLQLGENNVWFTSYFNDTVPPWTNGTGGVGYERDPTSPTSYTSFIDVNVGSAMYNKNGTCYIRIPFTANHTEFTDMTLKVRYDDGFIAYLNGTKVATRNFAGTPAWNSLADSSREANVQDYDEYINISEYVKTLRQGNNILAIHGLNTPKDSSDFLISVELVAGQVSQGDVSPSAIKYTGPVTLNNTACVKARVLDGKWSPLNEAIFAVGPVAENLRITEIMYHPEDTNDPNDPNEEFIELKNIGTQALNLNLVKFTNGIDFTFPNLELAGGQYVVVVKNRAAFNAQYPGFSGTIAGQYTGSLENAGERIRLEDAIGQTILDFEYKDGWRDITDGNGFSLTIINPSDPNINHWNEKDYWRASAYWGGSPGWDDNGILPNPGAVVINEVLAHSHAAAADWIELYNTTNSAINIGNWYLSDSASNLKKYRIAAGTSIPQNGYKVFYENTDFNDVTDPGCLVPFALSENGDTVYLSSAEPDGVLTGYRDVEDFGASLTDISFGRYHLGSTGNYNFVAMSSKTPNDLNAYPKVGPVVINEIMYNPDWPEGGSYSNDEYEYIELRNISASSVTLYDSNENLPWKVTDGIEWTFTASPAVTIPAGGYIVVVRNKTAFSWRYPAVPSGKIYGPYSGHLDNGGESLELSQPGDMDEFGEQHYIRVDRVNYSDGSHPDNCPGGVDLWPVEADGWGWSLSRKTASAYGNDPNNWTASTPSPAGSNP